MHVCFLHKFLSDRKHFSDSSSVYEGHSGRILIIKEAIV